MPPRGHEPEVVLSSELAAEMYSWEKAYRAERDPTAIGYHAVGLSPMAARDWLEMKSGVNIRTIYAIMSGERQHTSLRLADAILTAIDRHYLLGVTIHVIPNPWWSMEKYQQYMEERGCA